MQLQHANDELGFNLNTKKRPATAHLLIKINAKSIAAQSGLLEHDQVLTVDGVDCRNFSHQQVVKCIRNRSNVLRLLVCEPVLYQWTVRNAIHLDLASDPPRFQPSEQTPRQVLPLFEQSICTPDAARREIDIDQYIPYADYDPDDHYESKEDDPSTGYDEGARFGTSRSIHLQDRQPRLHIPPDLNRSATSAIDADMTTANRSRSPIDFGRIHSTSVGEEDENSTNGSLSAYDERYDDRYDDLFARDQLNSSGTNSYRFETKSVAYTSESRQGPYDSQRSTHRSTYTKQTQKPSNGNETTVTESFEDEQLTTTTVGDSPADTVKVYKPFQSQKTTANSPKSTMASRSATNLAKSIDKPVTSVMRSPASASINDLRPNSWKSSSQAKPLPTLVERPSTGSVDVSPIKSALEPTDESSDLPAPRLCVLRLGPDGESSYGFTVKTDKKSNVKSVIEIGRGSLAERAGLQSNDILIEVNGTNVGIDNHKQVTERIKSLMNTDLELLVLTELEHQMYCKRNVIAKSTQANVVRMEHFPQLSAAEHVQLPDKSNGNGVVAPTGFWGSFLNNLSAKQYQNYLRNKRKNDPRETNLEFQDKIKFFEKL
jgi:hypothetical protein